MRRVEGQRPAGRARRGCSSSAGGETMKILVNGEAQEVEQGTTLAQLVEQHGLVGKRFAIKVNQEVVPRSEYSQSTVHERDRIEIVAAIGGG